MDESTNTMRSVCAFFNSDIWFSRHHGELALLRELFVDFAERDFPEHANEDATGRVGDL
jgi:hypothetical protein